jgi:hypothetical protein
LTQRPGGEQVLRLDYARRQRRFNEVPPNEIAVPLDPVIVPASMILPPAARLMPIELVTTEWIVPELNRAIQTCGRGARP